MFIGRDSEQKVLNEYWQRPGNQFLVLYGFKGVGKTTLLQNFIQDKTNAFYLEASILSEREQLYQWSERLNEKGMRLPAYPQFNKLFQTLMEAAPLSDQKIIIIFDEFQNLCRTSGIFIESLFQFAKECNREILIILCSSSIEWIENTMIRKFGVYAKNITGFFKVRELSFKEFIKYFRGFSFRECIEGYAILGGIPLLWELFDPNLNLKENIIHNILNPNARLYDYGERIVECQLRETNVYNTILCALASDKQKLNDLYLHTQFSRAKISVYLKNLMELGIVKKEFSYDTEGHINVQKGVYSISNHFVDFTYRFLVPQRSNILGSSKEAFYTARILPYLGQYTSRYFSMICRDYMEIQNQADRLPIKCSKIGKWIGKAGTIDCVAQDSEGHTIVGLCDFVKPMMHYEDYEWLLFCAKQAKIKPDYVYLFTSGKFDEELIFLQNNKKNVRLLTLDNL